MTPADIDAYAARSRALDLSGIAWGDVPRHPPSPEVLRTRLHGRHGRPQVAAEETFHDRAVARFLAAETRAQVGVLPFGVSLTR